MTTVTLCSIISSSSLSPLPPKLNKSTPPPLRHPNNFSLHPQLHSTIPPPLPCLSKLAISRRNTALSLSIGALFPYIWPTSPPAFGFDIRISGPKDWLKEQKKKSIKYLLAPIVASREILNYAQQLLLSNDSRFEEKDMEDILGMLNSAARDCVAEDRSSLVAFQARTGVEREQQQREEIRYDMKCQQLRIVDQYVILHLGLDCIKVCTFKLVVSNASSLLNDDDPTKLEAEAWLNDLIRSFTFLNGLTKEVDVQFVSNRQKVADALTGTLSALNKFEQGIKRCIEA